MIQKTLITKDQTELRDYLKTLSDGEAFQTAGDRILLFSDQTDDESHLRRELAVIREEVPGLKVVGVTMPHTRMMKESRTQDRMAGYSFLLLDRSTVQIFHYDFGENDAKKAGKKFMREIRYMDHIAGIMLFSAGVEREIDRFLTAIADIDRFEIPIMGAQASATEHPMVCGSFEKEIENHGLVAIVFSGRGLHLHYNYEMGWKAIGKEMTVTGVDGNYCITEIDHEPAISIYEKYIGVEADEYFADNVREFPLMLRRGDRMVVRTPAACDENGHLQFIARVNEGDRVKLSYANPRRLLDETRQYVESMRGFEPQALFLIICENRARFLGEQAASDIYSYRSIHPEVAWVRGFAATLMDGQGGGVVNSAVISIGFREGAPRGSEHELPTQLPEAPKKGTIPLDQRLAMFLEQTTKELEEMAVAADAANTAKSEFLSQMSHEIRTPINAVLGMNEMILRESENKHVLEYAENTRIAGMGLLGIINDILDFSRIEAGRMEIVPYEYELASMINDLVNLIRLRAEEKGLTLRIRVNPDIPHLLYGDEVRIKQIITNLLTNAVKYTEKGHVELSIDFEKGAWAEEITLRVAVKDTGVGIRKEDLSKLFEAFERIDQERARRIEGTGLGINITQQLLLLMGSRLEVQSTYGRGSVFSFSLTQKVSKWKGIGSYKEALKNVESKRTTKHSAFRAPEARILVVDDAPMNLAVISGLLKRTRIQVDTAESGRGCLALVGQNDYDLVFLDHRMPEMDGVETLGIMQRDYGEKLKTMPVICLTANAVSGAKEFYLNAGFTDHLTKPVMVNQLEEMLQKYLPADKLVRVDENMPKRVADEVRESEHPLPEWLEELRLLHTDKGVEFCGGNEEYIEALEIFAGSIAERAAELELDYDTKDWKAYTIKIHALKSMARSVGATELSELARSLEEAGDSRDIAALSAGHGILISLYRSLEEPLKRLPEWKRENEKRKKQIRDRQARENGGHSILLVDDDEDFLRLTARWLGKEYRVETLSGGSMVMRYLANHMPELILLDYAMPDMSGPEVIAAIRKDPKTAKIPVVFLTGSDDRESIKAVEQYSPEGFLLKSMGKSALLMGIAGYFA